MLADNKNIMKTVDALQIMYTKFYVEHFLASYSSLIFHVVLRQYI